MLWLLVVVTGVTRGTVHWLLGGLCCCATTCWLCIPGFIQNIWWVMPSRLKVLKLKVPWVLQPISGETWSQVIDDELELRIPSRLI